MAGNSGPGGSGGVTAGSASPGGSSFDIEVTGKQQGAPLLALPGFEAAPAAPHAPLMDIDIEAG